MLLVLQRDWLADLSPGHQRRHLVRRPTAPCDKGNRGVQLPIQPKTRPQRARDKSATCTPHARSHTWPLLPTRRPGSPGPRTRVSPSYSPLPRNPPNRGSQIRLTTSVPCVERLPTRWLSLRSPNHHRPQHGATGACAAARPALRKQSNPYLSPSDATVVHQPGLRDIARAFLIPHHIRVSVLVGNEGKGESPACVAYVCGIT